MFSKNLCFIFMLAAFCSQASLFPFVTRVEEGEGDGRNLLTTAYSELIDIGPQGDRPVGATRIGLVLNYALGQPATNFYTSDHYIDIDPAMTLSEAGLEIYNKLGPKLVTKIPELSFNAKKCIGFALGEVINGSTQSPQYIPGACFPIPPGNDSCEITTPSVSVDHGVIYNNDKAVQNIKPLDIGLNCTAPMRIRMQFEPAMLNISSGLKYYFPLNEYVDAPSGSSIHTLNTQVWGDATGVPPGPVELNSVMTVSYY